MQQVREVDEHQQPAPIHYRPAALVEVSAGLFQSPSSAALSVFSVFPLVSLPFFT